MSLFWEPRWVRVKVSYEGVTIITCQDLVSKLYICPLCTDIDRICPEGRETNILVDDIVAFFSVGDLISHLRTHAHAQVLRRKLISLKTEEHEKEEG
ncbi:MAG: hypothetical protein J7J20_06910 [Desulfurococcales archaeon]|nr:hypothetical protein [Desulfurococcales archaeon]